MTLRFLGFDDWVLFVTDDTGQQYARWTECDPVWADYNEQSDEECAKAFRLIYERDKVLPIDQWEKVAPGEGLPL